MRKSRYREEQTVEILKEPEAGQPAAELCRKHGISEQTFDRWRWISGPATTRSSCTSLLRADRWKTAISKASTGSSARNASISTAS